MTLRTSSPALRPSLLTRFGRWLYRLPVVRWLAGTYREAPRPQHEAVATSPVEPVADGGSRPVIRPHRLRSSTLLRSSRQWWRRIVPFWDALCAMREQGTAWFVRHHRRAVRALQNHARLQVMELEPRLTPAPLLHVSLTGPTSATAGST